MIKDYRKTWRNWPERRPVLFSALVAIFVGFGVSTAVKPQDRYSSASHGRPARRWRSSTKSPKVNGMRRFWRWRFRASLRSRRRLCWRKGHLRSRCYGVELAWHQHREFTRVTEPPRDLARRAAGSPINVGARRTHDGRAGVLSDHQTIKAGGPLLTIERQARL